MSDAAEYWSYAREAQQFALNANNEAQRQSFLDMARVWTQLALVAEHRAAINGAAMPPRPEREGFADIARQ
jgi:hypothetical protein